MKPVILSAYIDSREQKMGKKTQAFFNQKGVNTQITTLKDGDVSLMLNNKKILLIERKTMADFAGSYITGHLQDQAIRMNDEYDYYATIVYGDVKTLKRIPTLKRITQKSIDKMTENIEILYKCPVFFVENEVQYLMKIMDIAETVTKANAQVTAKPKVSMSKRPDVYILRCQRGIGEKMALLLLKEFGSPQKVLNASRDELKNIKGVGDRAVKEIKALKKIFEEGV